MFPRQRLLALLFLCGYAVSAFSQTDITSQLLANNGNNNVELTGGSYTVTLDAGTLPVITDAAVLTSGNPSSALVYNGLISGYGTIRVSAANGSATLVLTGVSTYGIPISQQTEWEDQQHPQPTIYDGVNFGTNHGFVSVIHGTPNPPVLTIDPSVTVQLGNSNSAGFIDSRDQSGIRPTLPTADGQMNLDNIENNGTLDIEEPGLYQQRLGIVTGAGNVLNVNGAPFLVGTSTYTGWSDFYSMNIGTDHIFGAVPHSQSMFNRFVLAYAIPQPTSPSDADGVKSAGVLTISDRIYYRHFGGSLHNQGPGVLIFTGSYGYSDSGDPTHPSLSDDRLNFMDITRGIHGDGTHSSYHRLILSGITQFGDGTSSKLFTEGYGYIWLKNATLGFDYNGTVQENIPIGGDFIYEGNSPGNCNLFVVGNASNQNHVILTQAEGCNGLTKIDSGTVLQLGDGTTGNSSTLTITSSPTGTPITGTYSTSSGNGSILTAESNYTTANGVVFTGASTDTIQDDGELIVDNTVGAMDGIDSLSLSNISGAGGLTQMGTAPLTLLENTTYTGATTVANGTLLIGTNGTTAVAGSIASSSGVNLTGQEAVFDISDGGNQSIQDLNGIAGSTVNLGSNTLTAGTVHATVFAGSITGSGGLIKQGSGNLVLNGGNSFTGATQITAGTLVVGDGSAAGASTTSDVTVAAGGTLGGYGKIVGAVTNQGAVIAESANDTLTITKNYASSAAGSVAAEVSPSSSSLLNIQGSAALNGSLSIVLDAGTYAAGTHTLIGASGGLSGSFASVQISGAIPSGLTPKIVYTANAVELLMTNPASPKPSFALSASPASAGYGTPVTLTASLAAPSGEATLPTGSVTFSDVGSALGVVNLNGSGTAALRSSSFSVGTHTVTAAYSGNTDYNAVSASTAVTIGKINPSISLSATPTSAPPGTAVTFSASVASNSSATAPTGAVSYLDGSTSLGVIDLSANGAAFLSASSLAPGTHTVTAAYAGDEHYASAISGNVIVTITQGTASAADYSMSLSSSAVKVNAGGSANLTVTLTPEGGLHAPLDLTCTGLPAGMACLFQPAAVSLDGTPASSAVTIEGPLGLASAQRTLPLVPSGRSILLGLLTPFGLLSLVSCRARHTQWRRMKGVVRVFVPGALLAAALWLSGCGYHVNGRMFQVTITASGQGVHTHTSQLTVSLEP